MITATYIPCIASANIFQMVPLSAADRLEARTTSTCRLLIDFVFAHTQVSDWGFMNGERTYSPLG